MKSVTNDYKDQLKAIGREYQASITYTIENTDYTLGNEDLNAVTPHYESDIMKSVMKQLDLDSNVDIPIGTEINCQFGLLVGNSYEMLDYGNYIVYSSEKQEDVNSYRIICYDKMLNAEIDYEALPITYPITVKNYLSAIATKLGLTLATQEFVNDDVLIANEKYLTSEGESLGYTFRDVLDELAQVTASFICINNNDELEIRYITEASSATGGGATPLPSGYTLLSYIKTPYNGGNYYPYINTGYNMKKGDSISIDFMVSDEGDQASCSLCGYKPISDYHYYGEWLFCQGDGTTVFCHGGNGNMQGHGVKTYGQYDKNKRYIYSVEIEDTGQGGASYYRNIKMKEKDSDTIVFEDRYQTFHDYSKPLFILAFYNDSGSGRYGNSRGAYLYSAQIKDVNDNLLFDFVPVLEDSTNKAGLLNLVDNTFYTDPSNSPFEYEIAPTPTQVETIDEQLLNDTKVAFKKKFGPVNSVVLSRSLNSDNIYRKDDQSIAENGLCEINISENQILSSDDRGNFIDGIYNELKDLEFYENDYESKGITYLELGDKYQVQIGEETYPCVMLNDELNISSGFGELVHTDLPKTGETDYNTASKDDRGKQRTEFIVDKQNGKIESLASRIVDISIDGATTTNNLQLAGITDSEPFYINVKPIETNIVGLSPSNSVYPSDDLFSYSRTLSFKNTTTNEIIEYDLPDDLLYYDENIYDEFILDYENQVCKVIKRCEYDSNYNVVVGTTHEDIYDYPSIKLTKGDYEISVANNEKAYIYAKLMLENDYTSQMATEIVVESKITQTANQIMAQVDQKVGDDDIIASLNLAVEDGQGIVALKGNCVTIDSDNFTLDEYGNVEMHDATINGTINSVVHQEHYDEVINLGNPRGNGNALELYTTPNSVDGTTWKTYINSGNFAFYKNDLLRLVIGYGNNIVFFNQYSNKIIELDNEYNEIKLNNSYGQNQITLKGYNGNITCVSLTQTSKEENKKNIEKFENGLDVVKNTDIYKYNFNVENDDTKKHIGFVIGNNYKYREEITSSDNDGADIYSMVSVLWKAVQEQQEEIEKLKKQIKEMK